jgi:exopolysaccharide production protein ExoZ
MSPAVPALKSLQVGRALAATAVAAFHLSLMMGEARYGGDAAFAQYTKHGYLGVDFFFVLSGFIIIFAHGREIGHREAWRNYARRRFVRLFPVYWIYTAVFSALVLLGFGTAAALPTNPLDILTSISLVRFSAATPPLPVAWTLFHELAFYALFGLLIYNVRAGIAAFAIWALLCVMFFHHPGDVDVGPFNVYTAASNLYFLLGMGAYVLFRRGGTGVWETSVGAGVALAAAMAWNVNYDVARFILVCGFALALAGVSKLELSGTFKFPRWAVYVGDASYSIYLLHESLSGLMLKVLIKSGFYNSFGSGATYFVVLVLVVPLGCLAYAAVEKPLLGALRRKVPKQATRPVTSWRPSSPAKNADRP